MPEQAEFSFAGLDVERFAGRVDTPFFLFSTRILKENYGRLRHAYTEQYTDIRIDYPVKTNRELAVLQILCSLGASLDIAGEHELQLALEAGFPVQRLTLDRPHTAQQGLEACIRAGIHAFIVDSPQELERLEDIAAKLETEVQACLRVQVGSRGIFPNPVQRYLAKFGIPRSRIVPLWQQGQRLEHVRLIGLTTHVGSQLLTPKTQVRAVEELVELAAAIERTGGTVAEINLGGGIPSPTFRRQTLVGLLLAQVGLRRRQTPANVAEFGRQVGTAFAAAVGSLTHPPTLVLQPGRAIASTMGVCVTRVRAIKGQWVIVDASQTSLPESLFFGERAILPLRQSAVARLRRWHVSGPTLNTGDVLAVNCSLPPLEVGDLLVIRDAGAYSLSVDRCESDAMQEHWDRAALRMKGGFRGAPSTAYYRRREIALFRRYFSPMAGKRLLKLDLWNEVHNTNILPFAHAQGMRVAGVDISSVVLEQARARFEAAGIDADLRQSDIRALSFPDNRFDCVYSMGTVEHLPNPGAAISEVFRVLKPGGVAVIGVPNAHDP
ncbi:MAG: hypothetical protein CL878_12825, partial [Dehalococcoidia bacterium]|nr:hypothetical protein [Dehalococcoidia bacterium]